jgi:hypothetical protein
LAALAAGCAAAAPPEEVQAQTGGDSDMSGGGPVVDNCTDGDSCDTGSPGDCSMGHAVCNGNPQGTCVPNGTTQTCYDGPASTMGVGVCKGGMQTCIGALGSCDGEVKPAAQEDCFNDLDDDCDGVLNNGCPDHLTTGTPRALGPHGDATGGTAFTLRCPANAYVTKIVVYGDNTDDADAGLDITCATPTLVRNASTYTVTPTAATANPSTQRGSNVDTSLAGPFDCGMTGFNPGFYAPGAADPGGLDELGLSCAAGTLALQSNNTLTITLTKGPNLGVAGYTGLSGEAAFEDDCNPNEVLIGFDGRKNTYFNEVHAVCAPLQVVNK